MTGNLYGRVGMQSILLMWCWSMRCRQSILDVAGQVPPEAIQQLLAACKTGMYSSVQQQVGGFANAPLFWWIVLGSMSAVCPYEMMAGHVVLLHAHLCVRRSCKEICSAGLRSNWLFTTLHSVDTALLCSLSDAVVCVTVSACAR